MYRLDHSDRWNVRLPSESAASICVGAPGARGSETPHASSHVIPSVGMVLCEPVLNLTRVGSGEGRPCADVHGRTAIVATPIRGRSDLAQASGSAVRPHRQPTCCDGLPCYLRGGVGTDTLQD